MKKNYLSIIALALLLLTASSCTTGNSQPPNNEKITFIELGSVHCKPCIKMQPIIRNIEIKYGDQVKTIFYDVWTEDGKPYGDKYNIKLIPTQVFLDKEGKEYYRHEGFFPEEDVVKILAMRGVKE